MAAHRLATPTVRQALRWTAGLLAITAGVATIVAVVPGAAFSVRTSLHFALTGHAGSLHEAAAILTTNLRVAAVPFVAMLGRGPVRTALQFAAATMVLTNAAVIGLAAGAYGIAGLPFLVHVPLELCALGAALAATRDTAAISGVTAVALLCAAAGVETFVTPQ